MIVGYTTGVFDLLHVGHIHRLKRARTFCDRLVVGVSIDECVSTYKLKPIIPYEQRIELVRGIRYVDEVVPQVSLDKFAAWQIIQFDVLVVGDDRSQRTAIEPHLEKLRTAGVQIVFDQRYGDVSTSDIIERVVRMRGNIC